MKPASFRRFLTLIYCFVLLWPASLLAAEGGLKKTSLITLWLPQAQFAGYYMALEKGFYRQRGLDLTIFDSGPEQSALASLEEKRADFAVLWLSAALQAHDKGLPLVHIAQIAHHASILIVGRKSSGILKPENLDGWRLGVWGDDFEVSLQSFLEKHRLTIKRVPQLGTINLFLRGGIQAMMAMRYNEYHSLLNAGLNPEELSVFDFRNEGIDFPEDGLYALADTVKADPDKTEAFVRASLEGWNYAFAHPEETLDVVLRRRETAFLPANRMHEKWMLNALREAMQSSGKPGELNRQAFLETAKALRRAGLIRRTPDYDHFVKPRHELPK